MAIFRAKYFDFGVAIFRAKYFDFGVAVFRAKYFDFGVATFRAKYFDSGVAIFRAIINMRLITARGSEQENVQIHSAQIMKQR